MHLRSASAGQPPAEPPPTRSSVHPTAAPAGPRSAPAAPPPSPTPGSSLRLLTSIGCWPATERASLPPPTWLPPRPRPASLTANRPRAAGWEIGRASCRERVYVSAAVVLLRSRNRDWSLTRAGDTSGASDRARA